MAFEGTEQPGAAVAGTESTAGAALPSDTPAVQTAGTTDDTLAGAEGLEFQQPVDPDHVEVEYEGAKYKVPTPLKDAVLRQADYTRKTQSVAEKERAVEARQQELQEAAQLHGQFSKDYARLTAVDDRLEQLQKLDLQALNVQNPQQAQALHLELTQLQAYRGQLTGSLAQKQQQMQQQQQRTVAKQLEDAEAFLKREIKDWSPDKDRQLADYARANSIDPRELGQIMLKSPGVLVALNKAAQWDQFVKERTKKPPVKQPEPGTRVGGGAASPTKPLSEVTDPKEWAQRRLERKNRNR